MLFASMKEAILFLRYNADAIEQETGIRPVRAYYCRYCCGWHLTSKPNSYGRNNLIQQYGAELGNAMYERISPLVTKGTTVAEGLSRRLKELRHNLKFQTINCDKCRWLIDDLFGLFEVVIGARLEDKATIDKLLSNFSDLCGLFASKRQAVAVA